MLTPFKTGVGNMKGFIAIGVLVVVAASSGSASAHPTDEPHNDLEVIVHPKPVFPALAEFLHFPGFCEVSLEVSNYTEHKVVDTRCSNYVFCVAAESAVALGQYRVIDVPGTDYPKGVATAVFPFEYRFEDTPEDVLQANRENLESCNGDLVS